MGTVTLFAFDEGQKLSEHTAAFDALVYVLDGETEVAISKKSDCLKEGDMIMMPANQPHAVQSSHQVQNVPSHDKIVVADVL
jgi:quercetin dioxygenase-like cupin family protein